MCNPSCDFFCRCLCLCYLCCLCCLPGCADPAPGCRSSRDCLVGQACLQGRCLALSQDTTAVPQATPEGCAQAHLPDGRDLVLHEVLAAVPGELPWGDTNGDGLRDAAEDEFIELLNLSGSPVLTQGVRLYKGDQEQPMVELSTPCLGPGQALVILGGLRPDAAPPALPGALVEVAPRPMRLPDAGAALRVLAPDGLVLFEGSYPSAQGGSVTLWPQRVSHDLFLPHREVSALPASPGLCADGQPFSSGCPSPPPACPQGRAPAPGQLWLHEVLAAVPAGPPGDTNADGVTSATRDEFMELFNLSGQTLRLAGVKLYKNDKLVGELEQACLAPGQGLVWWAGLEPGAQAPQVEGAQVEVSARTWALPKQGSLLRLASASGQTLLEEALPASEAGSLLRPRPGDPWSPHAQWSSQALSPGRCADGAPLSTGCDPCAQATAPVPGQLLLHELLPRVDQGADGDGDGLIEPSADEFIELVNASPRALSLSGVVLEVDREARHAFQGCLLPGGALVLHSGQGALPQGPARRVRSQRALRLGNLGGTVTLRGAQGGLLGIVAYGEAPAGRSLQLWPELDPEGEYIEHPAPGLSPGQCADGSPLSQGCP